MDTVTVYQPYVVHAGQRLEFTDATAFIFSTDLPGSNPSLNNSGSIEVTADQSGFLTGMRGSAEEIWNRTGGAFSVTNLGEGDTWGYYTGYVGAPIRNDGSWNVSAAGYAGGAEVWIGQTFDNRGDFSVSGGHGAVGLDAAYGAVFTNEGVFSVDGGSEAAVGVSLQLRFFSFNNSGTINVSDADGEKDSAAVQIAFDNSFVAELTNSGVIRSPDYAIREIQTYTPPQDSVAHLTNTGRIIGDVSLGLGDDRIDNRGQITGVVDLGDGADTYSGSGGNLVGTLYGGLGDDSLAGGRGHDVIYGDGVATSADDGQDVLSGGAAADTLVGGGGDDRLDGGAAADVLTGGAGRDSFVFTDLKAANGDLITDLHANDTIVLAAIDADHTRAGDQAFHLVGALDGHAGEAALSYEPSAGVTSLSLDVDGDGVADSVIRIAGDHHSFDHITL